AQGNGDRPTYARMFGEPLEAFPADIVGGVADAKYRIEQQVYRAGAGTNHQVGAADGAGEAGTGLTAHSFDGEQQAHRQSDGEHREQGGETTVVQAGPRQTHQKHPHTSAGRAARLSSASDRWRSNKGARL